MIPSTVAGTRFRLFLIFFAGALVASAAPAVTQDGSDLPAAARVALPDVYTWLPASLASSRQRVRAGDPALQPALERLRAEAEQEMAGELVKVTDKPDDLAASVGGKNNYASVSGYFWPQEGKPDAPWVMRDGVINTAMIEQFDAPRMKTLQRRVITLGLAYYFTGETRYARRAADQLRAWFIDPATRMNPHLEYAQCVPNKSKGEPWGIIDVNSFPYLLDAVTLLGESGEWSAGDQAVLRAWFSSFTDWLWNSSLGRRERAAQNNHGTFYDLIVARCALFAGDEALARTVVNGFGAQRITVQIEPDGATPHEQKRAYAAMYTCWNLKGMADMLFLARRLDVDLWTYQTADGRSLRQAARWLQPYVEQPANWTFGDGKFRKTSPTELFWMLSAATGDQEIHGFFRKHMTPPQETGWQASRWMLLLPVE